ncbi:odorant receptor 46a-like [Bicyclus anynana]|uniref:Odorant receptor n=1 Tax=Bicyclus anynana TaxID=110368 RepID=A0A6J1NTB4_BICAN|nr:odorant receptor 46a-like [Bicyclus anynana]
MSKFLLNLEDPENPLLGPTLWGLQRWGMWQPEKGIKQVIYNTVHVLAILFVLSQYVELWFIRFNMDMAMRNLSVTMLSTVCVIKAGTFIIWQKDWRRLVSFVSTTEKYQFSKKDTEADKIIQDYTKYSRSVTYFYWGLVFATVLTVILAPFAGYLSSSQIRMNETVPYPEILSSWAPFEKSKGFGYWIMVMEHALICCYGGGIVANYDSNAVVLMTFFAGQLDLIKLKCSNLFGDGEELISYQVAVKRIGECHQQHVLLVKYSKILNSLLSPVLFLYVIICSLMLCASAVQLTTEGTTTMQQIWIAEYLIALVAQLFLYCWHSNKVLYMSLSVDQGVYSSAWWSQEVRVRRSIALLGGQLNRRVVFTAGPFTKLTVSTFIGILKGSYSYYTLLSNRE